MRNLFKFILSLPLIFTFAFGISAQTTDAKAEAIIKRAVEKLGGQKYLQAKSIVSSGNFTIFNDGQPQLPSTFVDVFVFPDKERTEFKQAGVKNVQANAGNAGWIFDGAARIIKEQSKNDIEGFRRSIRTSLDYLLRGDWRDGDATLTYVGKRQASLGKRNEVVRLTYKDGFVVEFEFSDDGLPMKSIYKRKNADGEDLKEEDRYAQFAEGQGVFAPFIVDHFINDKQTSRINYLTIQFNKPVSDSIFAKPKDAKELKKDLKF